MFCPNCGQPIKNCMECSDRCESCGVVIDHSKLFESSEKPKFSNTEYPKNNKPLWHYWDFPKNKDIPKQESIRDSETENDVQVDNTNEIGYKWEETEHGSVLIYDKEKTYKTVNEAMSDKLSWPEMD